MSPQEPRNLTAASRAVPPRLSLWLSNAPWWAIVAVLLGLLFAWQIATDSTYQGIFSALREGLGVTLFVTFTAYQASLLFGLLLAFMRLSPNKFIYQIATFYVEIVRGVPVLVLLLYVAFVIIPGLIDLLVAFGEGLAASGLPVISQVGAALADIRLAQVTNLSRVIVALVMAYAPFVSEIFRAGIESVGRGQVEAARSLGMSGWQAMRYIVLPQAIRNVRPALVNEMIAMLKDSSLVSVLGVRDITGEGRVDAARTFKTFETYNVMAFLYLSMTLILSALARWAEQRVGRR